MQHTAVLLGNSSTLNKRGEYPPRCNRTTPADFSLANPALNAQTIFSFSAVMAFHEALKSERPSKSDMISGEVSHLRAKEADTPLNIEQGQERIWGERHFTIKAMSA